MKWFSSQKLNTKFTIVIALIVFIPLVIAYAVLFGNLKAAMVSQRKEQIEDTMNQTYGEIRRTVDLCNMSTQAFLNNRNLYIYLERLKREEDIPAGEIVDFYQNDIAMLERMVNSNPYLYRIRVYAQSNEFSEMMPILFTQQRMEELPWRDSYESGQWQLDYADGVFGSLAARSSQHVMALVTDVEDYELGKIGTIEVAVDMATLFPQIYREEEGSWGCLTDETGAVVTKGGKEPGIGTAQEIIAAALKNTGEDARFVERRIGSDTVIIGCMPIRELSVTLIQMMSLKEEMQAIDLQRNVALTIVTLVFVLMILMINGVVRALLKRFYGVMEGIRQVQDGNLEIRVSEEGHDEISELGLQINRMLDRIQRLIVENVNRELMAKDYEIRALQNQINAHFIYNVLESVKMMAEIKEEYDISDAVTSLGRLLRYSMRWVSQEVTVREEIRYIRDYLELINLRFDYEIHLTLKISDHIYDQKIPKMSLQPIVENAIYHGIEELAEDASIYIKAMELGDDFVLEITDSGKGMEEEEVELLQKKIFGEIEMSGSSGNGIGLKNVQDRIQIAFGERYGIGVASKAGCYTKVTVTLPITKWDRN